MVVINSTSNWSGIWYYIQSFHYGDSMKREITFSTKAKAEEAESIFKTLFKDDEQVLDILNTKNVHLMLVDIGEETEKNLKSCGFDVFEPPKISFG